MAVDQDRKSKSKSEPRLSLRPIDEWAEDIGSRKETPQAIEDILPYKRGEYVAITGRTGFGLAYHTYIINATRAFCDNQRYADQG